MRSSEETLRLLEQALSMASDGVDSAEVTLGGGLSGTVSFEKNRLLSSSLVDHEVLAVRLLSEGKLTASRTTDCTVTGMQAAIRQARMLLDMLPAPETPAALPGQQEYVGVDGYDPETERATALDRMALVGRVVIAAHKHGLEASGTVGTSLGSIDAGDPTDGFYAIANTEGMIAYCAGTRATVDLSLVDARGAGAFGSNASFSLEQLDVDRMVEQAVQYVALGSDTLSDAPEGAQNVVLGAEAVAQLLRHIGETAGATPVALGRSFMSGRLGETVTGENVHLIDDYTHDLHRGAPFDLDGVARRKVPILENGVVAGPVSAFTSNVENVTGHRVLHGQYPEAARHLVMRGGEETLESLLAGLSNGIYIPRFTASALLDPVGLGVEGTIDRGAFKVVDGALVKPIGRCRFQVSVLDVLAKIQAMAESVWAFGAVAPAIRTEGISIRAA